MDQHNINELNDICVFCYKRIRKSDPGNNDGSETVNKFCQFLHRISTKRFNESSSPDKHLPTCEACVTIMDSFNELHQQVQCLQLQMEGRLETLKNVMKLAAKIPSRVKEFRKRYTVPVMQPNGALHGKQFKHLLNLRNDIKLQMTEYLSDVVPIPQAGLKKSKNCNSNNKIEYKLHPSQLQLQHPNLLINLNTNPVLGWLKTVIAVTMCCLPMNRCNHKALESVPALEKHIPEIVCVSYVFSEPGVTSNGSCTSLEVAEAKHCPEQISSPIPSSSHNFENNKSNSPVPTSSQVNECFMEKDCEPMQYDECTSLNTLPLKSKVSIPSPHLEADKNSVDIIKQENITISPRKLSLVQDSTDQQTDKMDQNCTWQTTDGDEISAVAFEIPSLRQLRQKFKCGSCYLTFSTSTRLNMHSKSCTNANDSDENEDEEIVEEVIDPEVSDNGSNYDVPPQASENKFKRATPMDEDSDSNYSDEELSDLNQTTKQNVKFTNRLGETDSWSVEECLEMYKKSDGRIALSEKSISTLKLTSKDIQLKTFVLKTCKSPGCESTLLSNDDLEYHRSLHGNFKCSFCEFKSDLATNLIEHELEHSSNRESIMCPRCPEVKMDTSDYKQHFVEHHLETSVKYRCAQCPVCSMSFPENDQAPLFHFVNEHDLNRLSDPAKVYHCDEDNCSAYFLTGKQLIGHFRIIHNKTKQMHKGKAVECLIECDICHLKFTFASALKLHKMRKHGTNDDVGLMVITDDGLTINDIVHNRNAKIPCLEPSCNQKFVTKEELDGHSKHHDTFKCNFCSVEKKFASDLALHELEHTDSVNTRSSLTTHYKVNCRRCEFSSVGNNTYINHHIHEHLNLPPYKLTIKCPICKQPFNASFVKRMGLKRSFFRHFLTHHDKSGINDPATLFNCAHCPAYFLLQSQLHLHNQRMHPEHGSCVSLSCTDCRKHFRDRYSLCSHRRKVHHNNDDSGYKFVCQKNNCNRRFEYNYDLERHNRHHNSFMRNRCGKSGKVSLKKQLKKQRGKRHEEHVCEQCGKKFAMKYLLERHMLGHIGSDGWQFMCDICSRKCPTRYALTRHKRTHLKIRPFSCGMCGANYPQRHHWKRHMLREHGVSHFIRKFTLNARMTS